MTKRTYFLGLVFAGACGGEATQTATDTETTSAEVDTDDPTEATTQGPTTGDPTIAPTFDPTNPTDPTDDTEEPSTGPQPVCGNGLHEGGEACDDGNDDNTDTCLDTCELASCGDGYVRPLFEECDDGNNIDDDLCSNTCKHNTICGNGVVEGLEACDDGNTSSDDGCLADCSVATCGDGYVYAGVEACDDGNDIDTDACRNSCEPAACGDGVIYEGVEQCDDGNLDDTDACASCATAVCGDGFIHAGVEQCDDGNDVDTDDCLTTCVAATCGDGILREGIEECDDGNDDLTDGCAACTYISSCKQLHNAVPEAPSGVYLVDPEPPFDIDNAVKVACEMETDGGGWTVVALLRDNSHWDHALFSDAGVVGDPNGFVHGATLSGLPGTYNEKIFAYREVTYQGDSQGAQWMVNYRNDPLVFADIDEPFGWGYRDSYGAEDNSVVSVCTHGCNTFRGLGMFHAADLSFGWCGTQGSNLGCPDGNNLCWESQDPGCPEPDRCAILSAPGTGAWFGVR